MNGQRTLRISTIPEARNHPILGLLFLTFFLSILNEYPPRSLLFLEEILVVLMRMSILSLSHLYYQLKFFSYTYVFKYLPLHYCFPLFTHLKFQRDFPVTLRYFNLFIFTNFPFHLFVCIINITFSPTLTHSNIFLFTTACFNP